MTFRISSYPPPNHLQCQHKQANEVIHAGNDREPSVDSVRVHRPVLLRVPSRMQEIDPCTSRMVGDQKTVNVYIGLNEQQSELPFSSAIYSEVQSGSASADRTLTLLKFQGALKAYLKDHLFYDHKPAGPSIANAMTRVHVHSGCRYAHADGKQVFVRASESFQNNTPWHDAAV